jgi:serine/threonine-protein kinase
MIDAESPITSPEEFIGQAGIVRRIFSRIGAERPQSVAVIGGKKSGKTSLLAYLAHPSVREKLLEGSERCTFCLVPSGSQMARSPETFLTGVRALLAPATQAGANGYDALRTSIDTMHSSGRRLILLLDDFHLITSNHAFPLEFFSFLRSMANNYNLAYVTTSFLELQKLCAIKDVQESPFFNIFTNLSLGMLTQEEGNTLFALLTGWSAEQSRATAAWCGSSPYLLKRAAARLLREKEPAGLDDAARERILLPELSPYFQEVIALLPSAAAKPLQTIARGKDLNPSEEHYLSPLVKQGFLAEMGTEIKCFSPGFCAFLRSEFSPKMLKGKG